MKAAWLACAALFPVFGFAQEEFAGVKRLEMHVSAGDIKVLGGETSVARVDVLKKRYDERCQLTMELRGDLLYIALESKKLFRARCEADFTVKLPREVALKIQKGAGDLKVEDTIGALSLEQGSGRVDIKARLSAFDARSGSGSLRVQGLEAPASVKTGSGSVRLVYEKVPSEGALEIRSGSGDAEVLFPKNAHVKTEFTAGTGSLKNRLGDSSDAKFTVSMKTGSGDLVVGKF